MINGLTHKYLVGEKNPVRSGKGNASGDGVLREAHEGADEMAQE